MMNRHLIYIIGALVALFSSGCALDEVATDEDMELTIQLTMASNMDTRAPRPLDGVNNWQHVTAVRVYVFRYDDEKEEYKLYQPTVTDEEGDEKKIEYIDVEEFFKGPGAETIYKDSEFEQHSVMIRPQLPDGIYKLLAIGVDEDPTIFDAITKDITWNGVMKTFESPITNEFFSGYSEPVYVSSNIGRNFVNIELKRCVAGVMLYVEKIHEKVKDTNIASIKLILAGFSKTTDIVNRTWNTYAEAQENGIVLATIDATAYKADAAYNGNKFYSGVFLTPSHTGELPESITTPSNYTTEPTLKLVFYDGDGKVVETKNVKLNSAYNDELENDADYDYKESGLQIDRNGLRYNILANHLYCIGIKAENVDQPIDLTDKKIQADIIAYGSWQADVDITL